MKVKKSKCAFAERDIHYLGHIINHEGVRAEPQKIEAISKWPQPRNLKELRGFLGLAGYYRKFIHHYGIIAKPLTDMLKKHGFGWTEGAVAAFVKLKQPCANPQF